jgi:hypothetical protein
VSSIPPTLYQETLLNRSDGQPEGRTPLIAELDKQLIYRAAFMTCMAVCIAGAIIAAAACLIYTNEHAPAGGLTLLWRVPMALCWCAWGFGCYYEAAKDCNPLAFQRFDRLIRRLSRR